MSRFFLSVFSFLAVMLAVPASAYVFEWGDPESGIVFRVPDTWRQMPLEDTRDVVRFRAPGPNEHAECSMRVEDDNRYAMFPEQVSDHVHNVKVDYDFWEKTASQDFSNHYINGTQRGMGLGNGFASMADVTYVPMSRAVNMRGLIWASQYHNKLYTLTCAAQFDAFYNWYPTFQYVLSTVQMQKEYHELPSGDYRYFPGDKILQVHTITGQDSKH